MTTSERNILIILLLLSASDSSGSQVQALDYDHSFSLECLAVPLQAQYEGGIAVNPEFNDGIAGWSQFGGAKIESRKSNDGNKFIVALNRNGLQDSLSQKFNLEKNKFYIISAWLQVSHGNGNVAAVVKTSTGSHYAGWSVARSGCWSMFKGGLVLHDSSPAELYFECDHPSVELWVDSISLQPFTHETWISHQLQSVEKMRKSKVAFRVVDANGAPISNASLFFLPGGREFKFGNAVSNRILTLPAYQDWFVARFKYTVFENEMKWQWNEPSPGQEDYKFADAMLQFVKDHNIIARGHNVVWENPDSLPDWAKAIPPNQLEEVTKRRQYSIMKRYSGQFIHWDVVNENLHFSYLEKMLGEQASTVFYQRAHSIDETAIPFLNDYNTIENETDKISSPSKYLDKIQEIRSKGYSGPLGIGLQGHFYIPPNLPYIRTALDALATANLPIWISELDVDNRWTQGAEILEQILRELHAHPAVEGITIWAPWSPPDCYRMCITDSNFKNLPTGDVVDKLLREWSHQGLVGTTDSDGYFRTSLFHGDYEVKINHPSVANSSQTYSFKVATSQKIKHLKVYA